MASAADTATFDAIYRFDFAAVHLRQRSAADYHRRTRGPFSVMYGYSFDGIAAEDELDIAAAERYFRNAVISTVPANGYPTAGGSRPRCRRPGWQPAL